MYATQLSPSSSDRPAPMSTNMNNANANAGPVQYYVFSADNNHIGPVTADLIGRGVVAGKVPNDAFVAPLGSQQWVPLASVPELNLAVSVARVAHSSVRPASQPGVAIVTGPPPPAVPKDLANFMTPPAPLPVPAPVAEVAQVPSPLSVAPAAPAAAAAPEAKKEEKKEEKKPLLDPRFKLLPLAIFGGFAFIGVVETVIALLVIK